MQWACSAVIAGGVFFVVVYLPPVAADAVIRLDAAVSLVDGLCYGI